MRSCRIYAGHHALTDVPTMIKVRVAFDDLALCVALMLAGANGQAQRVAPCLVSTDAAPSAGQLAEAKLILLGAIMR
jgi:hypothetical protein